MWLENFTYLMPIWLLVVVAWFPATVVALTMRLYAFKKVSRDQENLLRSTIGVASTAYVFFASFSVNALWNQSLEIYRSWEKLVFKAKYLEVLVENSAPAARESLDDLFDRTSEYLQSPEVLYSPLTAAGFFAPEGGDELDQIVAAADSPGDVDALTTAYGEVVKQGQDYLTVLNAPGIPDVHFVAIVLLGLMVAGLVALNPPRIPTRFSTSMLAATVFLIGLLQLPLWVLNSQYFEARLIGTLPLTEQSLPPTTGQTLGVSAVGLALIVIVGLLTWEARARQRREKADSGEDRGSESGDTPEDAESGAHEVLRASRDD